jgi:hypothetical protein
LNSSCLRRRARAQLSVVNFVHKGRQPSFNARPLSKFPLGQPHCAASNRCAPTALAILDAPQPPSFASARASARGHRDHGDRKQLERRDVRWDWLSFVRCSSWRLNFQDDGGEPSQVGRYASRLPADGWNISGLVEFVVCRSSRRGKIYDLEIVGVFKCKGRARPRKRQ